MEIQHLTGFVLLLVFTGLLLGVGVLILDDYARVVRTPTTVTSTGYNLSTAGTKDFAETYCSSVTGVANGTTSWDLTTYNVKLSDKDGCVVSYDAIAGCGGGATGTAANYCNITYVYGAETKSATAATDVNSAITPIASTWLPLVVTVAILAIILTLVITSFAGGGRKGKE